MVFLRSLRATLLLFRPLYVLSALFLIFLTVWFTAQRFCPTVYTTEDGTTKMILALASADLSVSIWTLHEQISSRWIISGIFPKSQPCDLSWSPLGDYLWVCGEDGFRGIKFQSWGDSKLTPGALTRARSLVAPEVAIPQVPSLFQFEKRRSPEPELPVPVPVPLPILSSSSNSKKRRIQPIMLSAPEPEPIPVSKPRVSFDSSLEREFSLSNLKHPRHPLSFKERHKSLQRKKRKRRMEKSFLKRRKLSSAESVDEVSYEAPLNDDVDVEQYPVEEVAPEPDLDPHTLSAVGPILPPCPPLERNVVERELASGALVRAEVAEDDQFWLISVSNGSSSFNEVATAQVIKILITEHIIALLTADFRLSLFSLQGRKLCPPILLENELALVDSNENDMIVVVDVLGQVSLLSCFPSVKLVWRSSLRGILATFGQDVGIGAANTSVTRNSNETFAQLPD